MRRLNRFDRAVLAILVSTAFAVGLYAYDRSSIPVRVQVRCVTQSRLVRAGEAYGVGNNVTESQSRCASRLGSFDVGIAMPETALVVVKVGRVSGQLHFVQLVRGTDGLRVESH